MVAKSENSNQTEELMLLTKVGGGGEDKKRVFRCKTCLKEFSSFQALGGHCTSHIKPIRTSEDQSPPSSTKDKPMSSHKCETCGAEFSMGQALGGHMTRHRNERENTRRGALVTRSFLPEETPATTTLKKSSSDDRSVDSVESVVNLKLELGLSIS